MLPVTILTGFLGGGKTTLLRRLLASPWGRRLGILLNEQGVAGIDALADKGVAGFVELAEGCVCCVDQPDLIAALEGLAGRGDLDRIVLETTGLADPLPISWTLARPDLAGVVSLEAVVTLVDAANFQRTRVEEWDAQVRCADLVVLSKIDLAGAAGASAAQGAVRALNPSARVLTGDEALVALVDPDSLDAIFGTTRATANAAAGERPLARHGDFQTRSIRSRAEYDSNAIEDLVEDLPDEVFRAKGIARVAGGRWLAFQAVGGRATFDLAAVAPAHGESRMAFFGKGLDRCGIEARVAACATEPGGGSAKNG